ncbi:MAG TPA: ATP-binding cassette domain-containing protein [Acidimicrobiales bacterium]|jgi:ABC-2 type transport system ATP-binding protein|nr:ATP-binding cassette domain-containing protein [Acidimicrobiales bacterium]
MTGGTGTGGLGGPGGLPIEFSGLSKHFGPIRAVENLTCTVTPGKVTGFLGPNGSGKTTTLRMLLGLVAPSTGTATIGGRPYRDLTNPALTVGAVLEATGFHPSRRARSHLLTVARACGQDDRHVDAALDLVGLHDDAKRKVGGFSLGMRQRLELAGALIGDPDVLILDEPSNGLDPQGIAWLRDFMRYLAGEGKTVLVSSHLLSEMAQTIDEVVILSQGQLRAQGTLESITGNLTASTMRVRTPETDRLDSVLTQHGLAFTRLASDQVAVHNVTPESLGPLLAQAQIILYELVHEGTDLESVFLTLTEGMGFGEQGAP